MLVKGYPAKKQTPARFDTNGCALVNSNLNWTADKLWSHRWLSDWKTYRLVSNIRRTSIIRRTPTLGNSQLEFSPTISLAKTSNTRRTPSFDFWVSIVDKVRSRPTWSELLRVAWDFDSPWIKGPMTPYQSRPYARHVTVIPAAKLWWQALLRSHCRKSFFVYYVQCFLSPLLIVVLLLFFLTSLCQALKYVFVLFSNFG